MTEVRICVNGRIGVQLQSASLPAYMKAMEAVRLFAAWKQTKPDPSVLSALEIFQAAEKKITESCPQGRNSGFIWRWL